MNKGRIRNYVLLFGGAIFFNVDCISKAKDIGTSYMVDVGEANHQTFLHNSLNLRGSTPGYSRYVSGSIDNVYSPRLKVSNIREYNAITKELDSRAILSANAYNRSSVVSSKGAANAINGILSFNKNVIGQVKIQKSHNLDIVRSYLAFLPKVDLDYHYAHGNKQYQKSVMDPKERGDTSSFGVKGRLNVFNKMHDFFNVMVATNNANVASIKTQKFIEDEIKSVIKTVAELQQYMDNRKNLYKLLNFLSELLVIVQKQQMTNIANNYELKSVQIETQRVLFDIRLTDNRINELRSEFKFKTGMEYNPDVFSGFYSIDQDLSNHIQDIKNNSDRYLGNNLQVRQSYAEYVARKNKRNSAAFNTFAPFNVDLELGRVGSLQRKKGTSESINPFPIFFKKGDDAEWVFKVSVSANIFNGCTDMLAFVQGVQEADGHLDLYKAVKEDVESKLCDIYDKYQNTLYFVEHQQKLVDLKAENITNIKKQSKIGTKSVKDFLEASIKWYDDLKKLSEFRAKLIILVSDIYSLVGLIVPSEVGKDVRKGDIKALGKKKYYIDLQTYKRIKSKSTRS